ncbi:protein RRNAD1 isoform X6 [Juglans regia]|uniref:Protein RRNAD1 isoform X6 n=1 Tax=Juglans regia TaxID=51240 RepID=A0A6P9EKH7_JUGRE|nr:protein RRNAD1 isoform X6 [Juglans regia]
MSGTCKYSCDTATHTLQWINAIIDFLRPYAFLIHSHVVNFFKDRQWEAVDKEWMDCLRKDPVENLLLIPSGVVQDHWPVSLKDFVLNLRSLVFPREPADLHMSLPGMHMVSVNSVLAQGMNMKKKHEVEVLSAIVSSIADSVRAHTIVDVGAGQGYLAQVLSFQYQHSVIAIDACSHHGRVTDARAERIKKHYAAQMRKSKAFLECKEAKAVVSIGCCYNLLSEEGADNIETHCGFPMSSGVKSAVFPLGKSSRDLACQSAERWRSLEKDDGLHNFELHSFRAAFQLVLSKYYPEVMETSPSIGRQGKALRRRQQRKVEAPLHHKEVACPHFHPNQKGSFPNIDPNEPETDETSRLATDKDALLNGISSCESTRCVGPKSVDKYKHFEKFTRSGLCRLGLKPLERINFHEIWKEAEPFTELIGPYWSLRAALGPLLETFLLLDRLLFLQEQGHSVEVMMLPIFDPEVSPRNVAIIARKNLPQI